MRLNEAAASTSAAESAAWIEGPAWEAEGVDGDGYNMELGGFFPRAPSPARKATGKNFKPSDTSIYNFLKYRDEFVAEFLRLDGCGDASEAACPGCSSGVPTIRCLRCYGEQLYCVDCCVEQHANHPLHVIERWDGTRFTPTSLKTIGLRVQFGHAGCLRPLPGHPTFVVLDLGYIHEVTVDFCGCERRLEMGHARIQLLRRRWFPATEDMPRTAATFRLLDFFHAQTLQAKTTMYDFYTALERVTDGTGGKLPRRYREFLRMTRKYRHLLMLKRAGRGHAASGAAGTAPGELAVECPACPRPGVNLPPDWESAPPEIKFLYILFLAFDACFRLKRRMISSELRDPGLGTGWAYFLEQEPYREFLLTVTKQTDMSTCSGLAALDYANTKFSRGYSTTGVGMGVCARHEFIQPTGVGDLQRGEHFANIDWIFAAILRWKDSRLFKVISYDIICQWWKHLYDRLRNLPPPMRLTLVMVLFRFVIPKMHIHSHTLACQLMFSLNFLAGAGQTDGEGIERPWANIGGVAMRYWNWSKLISLAQLIRRRLDNAKQEVKVQKEGFEAFSAQQAERVPKWKKMVEEFEKDSKNKNPYEVTERGLTEAQVRLQFTEEEAARTAKGVPSLHDVSPSSFIYAGLDLEDQQRRIKIQAELKKAGTMAQKIDLLGMRRKLSRGIVHFRKLQATYTPGALQALARLEPDPTEQPEDTPLMLPSALDSEERKVGCIGGVELIEARARDAQCSAALMRLRNQLHIKTRFMVYKKRHSRHQGANTRSRALVARNESKISMHSGKYQAAWRALRRLVGSDAKKVGWRQLQKGDIRMMEDPEELSKREAQRRKQAAKLRQAQRRLRDEGELIASEESGEEGSDGGESDEAGAGTSTTENKREVSWIWTMAGTTGSDAELEEGLRIEWAKAWAR
ncbi:hypothetical protein FB451DRAFT_1444162 [Mycena latifolia]|nr:hypothetical protein FB451DRAFT_1444162 [Mycena latifolia]